MTEDRPTRSSGVGAALATVTSAGVRLVVDVLIVGLWVLLLTLLFLATAWPRWAFYALLVVGVAGYVQLTSPWWWSRDARTDAGSAEND